MRFFIYLPRIAEKPQLKPSPNTANTVVFFMQNQVSPVCQGIVSLGLGISGIVGGLCTPVLANLMTSDAEELSAVSNHSARGATAGEHLIGAGLPVSDVLPLAAESVTDIATEPVAEVASLTAVPLLSNAAKVVSDRYGSQKNAGGTDPLTQGYENRMVDVENKHQPKFIASSCDSTDCETKVTELLADPAMAHIDRADMGLAEESPALAPRAQSSTVEDSGLGSAVEDFLGSSESGLSDLGLSDLARSDTPERLSQVPDLIDSIPRERIIRDRTLVEGPPDEDLGELRLQLQRSRPTEDLGILRLRKTAEAAPKPPRQPIAFLSGRLGFLDSDNVFRSDRTDIDIRRLDDQIFQSGLTLFLFPKLSESTNLYASAGTSLARYNNFEPTEVIRGVNYNQIGLQLGIRQKLFPRTFAQLGWRNQTIYTPGYRRRKLTINSIEGQISHRSILNSRMWIDGFYQARLGFADINFPEGRTGQDSSSRFRQTLTLSFNYGVTPDLRTSLLYQLDFEDFTQVSRFDTYQQVIGSVSYKITPEARLSLFGGTRFGRSSKSTVNLDDTFYGAGLNVSIPLF